MSLQLYILLVLIVYISILNYISVSNAFNTKAYFYKSLVALKLLDKYDDYMSYSAIENLNEIYEYTFIELAHSLKSKVMKCLMLIPISSIYCNSLFDSYLTYILEDTLNNDRIEKSYALDYLNKLDEVLFNESLSPHDKYLYNTLIAIKKGVKNDINFIELYSILYTFKSDINCINRNKDDFTEAGVSIQSINSIKLKKLKNMYSRVATLVE